MSTFASFVGERLVQARKARGLSAGDFSDLVELDRVTVSRYETGKLKPKQSTAFRMASVLNFPVEYFSRPLREDTGTGPLFWRARLTAPKKMLERTAIRTGWLEDIIELMESHFDFPDRNLPDFSTEDALSYGEDYLEKVAAQIREHWLLPSGPLPHAINLLESSGVFVSRCFIEADKMDAVSRPQYTSGYPYMLLALDGTSACRQRFDACHELAHIIVHKNVTEAMMKDKQVYKTIEKQADYLASCLLLPAEDFADELYAPTLDAFLSMKERWQVSVGAMIMRCKTLKILDKEQISRMFITYSRRGWRKGEPFDDSIEKERPNLIRSCVTTLLDEGVYRASDFARTLSIPVSDLEQLCELDEGTLKPKPPADNQPTLKSKGNVVSLGK